MKSPHSPDHGHINVSSFSRPWPRRRHLILQSMATSTSPPWPHQRLLILQSMATWTSPTMRVPCAVNFVSLSSAMPRPRPALCKNDLGLGMDDKKETMSQTMRVTCARNLPGCPPRAGETSPRRGRKVPVLTTQINTRNLRAGTSPRVSH